MAIKGDPQAATAKWVANLSSSTAAITAGVNAVTVAPGQLAAAASQKWLQNTQAAADKWKQRVGAVSLSQWQQAMINVGAPRVASGAQANQGKMQDFMTQFLPFLATQVQTVRAMPSTTLDQNIARSAAMIRATASFKRK